uniref:Uncharacterized protein n=1 Tax=Triticum urartu TaxID=4572 RepID=A0A8R7UVV9_TRIUA
MAWLFSLRQKDHLEVVYPSLKVVYCLPEDFIISDDGSNTPASHDHKFTISSWEDLHG